MYGSPASSSGSSAPAKADRLLTRVHAVKAGVHDRTAQVQERNE